MTGAEALRAAIPRLRAAGIDDAARDARLLLAHAMPVPADRLTLHLSDPLSAEAAARYDMLLSARCARQPVSQIIGQRLFWGRRFLVTPDVLDPRPETETLVAEALTHPFDRVLDLGTGSGCIVLTLLAERPAARGLGIDLSAAALSVAAQNRDRLGLTQRADLAQGNWFGPVNGRFDLIVSNPPYIAADEMAGLAADVRDWEPHLALTPGGDGLDAYRAICAGAPGHLQPGGRVLLEIGPTQAAALEAMLVQAGLSGGRVIRDLEGRDRVVAAQMPG